MLAEERQETDRAVPCWIRSRRGCAAEGHARGTRLQAGSGKWSVREIVHHLADSEMTAAVRLRLLIAEDRPTIHGYDQDEFARRLYYDRPHEASLELFRLCAIVNRRNPRPADARRMGARRHAHGGRSIRRRGVAARRTPNTRTSMPGRYGSPGTRRSRRKNRRLLSWKAD